MKSRLLIVCLVAAMSLGLTGCIQEEMYELTEAERQAIIQYSAHIIGEFNKNQTEGFTSLSADQLASLDKKEEEAPDSSNEQTGTGSTTDNNQADTGSYVDATFTDVLKSEAKRS